MTGCPDARCPEARPSGARSSSARSSSARSSGARPAGISRRGFLGLGAATAATPLLSVRTAYAEGYSGDVLVVLSLRGGMDGLSLVAPVGDPDYARLRPTIAVPTASGLPTGDRRFALHPGLTALKPLWDAGRLGAVHAVGSPDGSRSHFQATEELERAAPGTSVRTGWLDRVLGSRPMGTVFQSVQLGSGSPQQLLAGPSRDLAARSLKGFSLSQSDWVGPRMGVAVAALHEGVDSPAVTAARTTLAALSATATVVAQAGAPQNGAVYPDTTLGRALADVARLVRVGAGLQTACVDLGDWDMHSGLGKAGTGWMADQSKELAGALAAFATDLGSQLDRVCLVTMSEFGRRAAENGSGGVDHGFGNAVLLMGGGIVGGQVHGRWPGLTAAALDHGDLAGTTDYRSVLAELLVKRTGLPTAALAQVFPGFTPQPLGVARAA